MNKLNFSLCRKASGVRALLIILLVINFSSFSQEDTFNREVQVVREYNPSITDAFKINDMPLASDTLKSTPVFNYQLKGKAIITPPEMVPMTVARLAKEPLDKLFPAYIQGYIGNYDIRGDIIGGKLLYNLVRNEKFVAALNIAHESSFGDIELENKDEVEADYHETKAGLYLRHFFNKSNLSVNMDFNNFAYRYYGFENIFNTNTRQRQTVFDMNARLNNRVLKNSTQYDVLFGFYIFENKTGVVENSFLYKGDFNFELNEFILRFETSVDYAGSRIDKVSNPFDQFYTYENRDYTLLQINPALIRKQDNFLIKLGVRIGQGFDILGDKFYFSPDVGVNLTIENAVMIQAGITGEVKPNSYRGIMAENPFINTDLNVKTGFHQAKFFAGISGNFNSKTSFGFRVEYGNFASEHFFVNRIYPNQDSTIYNYDNKFDVQYDDGRLLSVSGELKANIVSKLDLVLRAAYYGWKTDSLEKAWHKPNMELGFRAIYKATKDLHFSAVFNVLGERFALIPPEIVEIDGNKQIITNTKILKPVYDFNLGANYTLNSRWHFFCTIQNLFASKYYQFNGYPMHGINARIGAGYSF